MTIGIDPGFSGAVAFLEYRQINNKGSSRHPVIYDMPLATFKKRKVIDSIKLFRMFEQHLKGHHVCTVVIEDVTAMPGQGVTSMFRFGYGAGVVEGVLAGFYRKRMTVYKTPPSVWKSALGLGRNKKESLELAKKKFPGYEHYFEKAKHDGRAEAALLAAYGKEL